MLIQRLLLTALVLTLLIIGISYAQEGQQQRGNYPPPPPRREFPKPDSALIQQMFDKMNKAIEGKADSPAVNVFQNIQVWKQMPAGRLLGMMRGWTRNLGVDCSHCHVIDQWEKDDKAPKLTARAMDKFRDDVTAMVRNIKSITDEHASVSCWTCHRGQPVPETFAPRPDRGPQQRKGN
ncbi:MAG TPA: photosynthetic reaction center cytochrome c subunit family protein [Bacteroidota bacterium]|jgi:hypothetical protein|nr:photosynthetic reaction center cytochrome c subunit family protein [Bacteroidota bacterium]